MNPNKKETIYMSQIELSPDGPELLQFFVNYVHKREEDNSFYFNGKIVRGREAPITFFININLEQEEEEDNIFDLIEYGSWNDCPSDEELYSTICEWTKKYGVKVLGLSTHSITFHCSRELTEQQIEELASRIIQFCPSSVELQSQRSQKELERKIKGEYRFDLWWD